MKNVLKSLVVLTVVGAMVANSTLAAFTAKATVHNSTFSTGNAGLRFLNDMSIDDPQNEAFSGNLLTDIPTGPDFQNIFPNWTQDYGVKVYNAGTVNLVASALGIYVNDTSDLRNQIMVEALAWTDTNHNGVVDGGEVGSSYGAPMTLEQWRSTPFTFGQLNTNTVLPVVLRFSTGDLADTYQGQTTVFDFEFDGTTTGATNP